VGGKKRKVRLRNLSSGLHRPCSWEKKSGGGKGTHIVHRKDGVTGFGVRARDEKSDIQKGCICWGTFIVTDGDRRIREDLGFYEKGVHRKWL